MGSMAAGAVTGALFKSTGMPCTRNRLRIFSHLGFLVVSWGKTRYCCCYRRIRHGRTLELCEEERLMRYPYVFTTLISPLIPALVSWADL